MKNDEIIKLISSLHDKKIINDWIFQQIIDRVSDEDIDLTPKNVTIQNIKEKDITPIIENENENNLTPEISIEQEENFGDIEKTLNAINENEIKVISDQEKKNMLIKFTKQIYSLFLNSDLPKYYNLSSKISIENDKVTVPISKRDSRDEKVVSKFSNMSISDLKKNFHEIKTKRMKVNLNDRGQIANWLIKTKELIEICRLLSIKSIQEKESWLKTKKNLELESKKYSR